MPGRTLSEKILARAAGLDDVKAGEIVWVNVDTAMMDDILGPRVQIADGLKQFGDTVWDPRKIVVISDHYTPPATIKQAEIVKFTRDWSTRHDIQQYYEFAGPCHQVMVENGHVLPGTLVLGTDSHTCMGGALGAFATGIGSTEMLGVVATGWTWLKVPESILVRWKGTLPKAVMAKDLVLHTIGVIGHAGATYKAVEFMGETIDAMSVDQRLAITNMAVEMGAKVGLMQPDDKVAQYLADIGHPSAACMSLKSDADAMYCAVYDFDAAHLSPKVACPHEVDNVCDMTEVAGTKIHQAYLGSCTGGRYSDLEAAAAILQHRKIAKGVRMLVSPASQTVWKRANDNGVLDILVDAGAVILPPTCGVCVGLHSGMLAAGEICISSSNRNFMGRMGSPESEIYLGSPMSVAASAITGVLASPQEFLEGGS